MKMKLSPIEVYGMIIPENAPPDIFYHYARVLGKSENKCRNATYLKILQWSEIASSVPNDIKSWTEEHYSNFARFINPQKHVWTKSQLMLAWEFIVEVLNTNKSFTIKVKEGYPTPENPKTLSPLLCFSVCSRVKPTLNLRSITVEQMYTATRGLLFSDGITGLINMLQQCLIFTMITSNNVEGILNLVENYDTCTELLSKNVKRRMNNSERFQFIRSYINEDINERIERGCYTILEKDFEIPSLIANKGAGEVNTMAFYEQDSDDDFNDFENRTSLPFMTLSLIGHNQSDFEFGDMYAICLRNKQVTRDMEMGRERICAITRAAYFHNKDISDSDFPQSLVEEDLDEYPPLTDDFNPSIPPKAYHITALKELAYNEGIIERLTDLYDEYELHELLQVNLLQPKFWTGLCYPCKNEKTIFMEDVEDVDDPISFGVRGGPYYIYSQSELAQYFNNAGTLQNPASEEVVYFPPPSIRQLLRMLDEGELKDSILAIQERIGSLEMNFQVLMGIYNKEENKEIIRSLIRHIHCIGMFMRGWKSGGSEELPVRTAIVKNYDKVEENTNQGIGEYLNVLETAPEFIQKCFNEMPIWKFRQGQFLHPNHESNTVRKRIDMVLKGENVGTDMNNCIRVSSNYFCATSFRLAKMTQLDLGYDIEDLREIS